MIRLKIKAKKSWPVVARQKILEAAHWVANELKIDTNNDITIKLVGYHSNDRGSCLMLKPNKFLVFIHAKWDRPAETVFHEFTHIKQHIYNGFELLEGTRALWRSAPFHYKEGDYWTLPWEMDARRTELLLSKKFLEHNKNNS